jgi:hypothetical protein
MYVLTDKILNDIQEFENAEEAAIGLQERFDYWTSGRNDLKKTRKIVQSIKAGSSISWGCFSLARETK